MSKRLATLTKRFVDARADVDASKRELREASARKLAKLQALPDPAARLAGLKDPALTPYDRDRLEQTVANLLPRRRVRVPRSLADTMHAGLRHARYRWRGLVLLGLISIPVMVIAAVAASRTGQSMGIFNNNYNISWTFADGHTESIPVPAGAAVVVAGRMPNGDFRLRYWKASDGYGVAIISPETLARITKF
ncbi:hypothetical protein [Afipia birgiae]|jgi:hypothetical protein|uniref:hypothetical protein n=1 Tax=Afipia birgiae TaxID=151414 RepID=UPI000381E5D8|nr:hypothetical protein [Afipia birgiae]MBX9822627.1 hypothetical protein [Afipia birgiae]